ncbi:MAG TPA: GNAT family N-acetyltransferase [Chloroflexota bacterium]|nr:GNAT family N-acetyltransferase [Chloroflexota bacterium]
MTASNSSIRPAVPDDAEGMAQMSVATYRAAHRGQVPDYLLDTPPLDQAYTDSARNWRRALEEIATIPTSREAVFVAVDDGRIVGIGMGGPRRARDAPPPVYAAIERYPGEVYTLYVAVSHQRRGIGRRLLRAIFRHLVESGMPSVMIGALTANAPARRFYETVGGRQVGERPIDVDGTTFPETVYGWDAEDVTRHLYADIHT